jgi:hypothetical protein
MSMTESNTQYDTARGRLRCTRKGDICGSTLRFYTLPISSLISPVNQSDRRATTIRRTTPRTSKWRFAQWISAWPVPIGYSRLARLTDKAVAKVEYVQPDLHRNTYFRAKAIQLRHIYMLSSRNLKAFDPHLTSSIITYVSIYLLYLTPTLSASSTPPTASPPYSQSPAYAYTATSP